MVRRQQAADRAIRLKSRSPGRPKFQRHVEVAFLQQIAKGLLAEEAAAVEFPIRAADQSSAHHDRVTSSCQDIVPTAWVVRASQTPHERHISLPR